MSISVDGALSLGCISSGVGDVKENDFVSVEAQRGSMLRTMVSSLLVKIPEMMTTKPRPPQEI